MKILYIKYKNEENSGGNIVSKRNFISITDVVGVQNTINYEISRKKNQKTLLSVCYDHFIDFINLNLVGLTRKQTNEIISIIMTNPQINIVFLDNSLLGFLGRKIKKRFPKIKIITFFHNVEYIFYKQGTYINKRYYLFYRIPYAYFSEKCACRFSDKIVVLNKRDKIFVNKYYNRDSDAIIPVTIKDKYTQNSSDIKDTNDKIALFVGSYFYPNIQGISWFVENVLPFTDIKLWIVGNGMNKLQHIANNISNVEIFDNVPDLTYYYDNANFVVLPLFSGSGMKVKTAEALMFGKYIIGTDEAFTGYDICEKAGKICNNAEEFVVAIKQFNSKNKFNSEARKIFIEKYSNESSLPIFEKILKDI